MIEMLRNWIEQTSGLSSTGSLIILRCGVVVVALLFACLAYVITKRVLLRLLAYVIKQSKVQWDDVLLDQKVFSRLAHFAPAIVLYLFAGIAFSGTDTTLNYVQRALEVYMLVVGIAAANSFVSALIEISRPLERKYHVPFRSCLQGVRITVWLLAIIFIASHLIGKEPWKLLAGMTGLTAVLILVFKDTILGFVGGIQLTTNNMISLGDWIEMPQYGADGDVIDITLTTVKVQNWDKTVSTIPTYALVANSFKNWRGMSESGGRRIKRALYVDMHSIRFCTEEMLEKFSKFQAIAEYIERKKHDVAEHNAQHKVDAACLANGRNLTNIGTFRAYVVEYLRRHPMVHPNMTFLVRQLQPTDRGLPIEIYVFCTDKRWAHYEAIQADIFDHLLAIIPEFDLRVFQSPAGTDFRAWAQTPRA